MIIWGDKVDKLFEFRDPSLLESRNGLVQYLESKNAHLSYFMGFLS